MPRTEKHIILQLTFQVRSSGRSVNCEVSMKKYFHRYISVFILLGIALFFFLTGSGFDLIFKAVWNHISGFEMDDMGGYTLLFSTPLIAVGFFFSLLLRGLSLLLLIASGITFCIITFVHLYRKGHTSRASDEEDSLKNNRDSTSPREDPTQQNP